MGSPGVTASPIHAGQQQMASSSPMPIPGGGGGLNIYQHTPFCKFFIFLNLVISEKNFLANMDASYTASPQLPRHMQQQQASQMAASYTGGNTGLLFGSGRSAIFTLEGLRNFQGFLFIFIILITHASYSFRRRERSTNARSSAIGSGDGIG